MRNLVFYEQREIKAKGLTKEHSLVKEKVEDYLFIEDMRRLLLWEKVAPSFIRSLKTNPFYKTKSISPKVFYPACGMDILFPLFFLEKVFPTIDKISLTLNDIDDNLQHIKTILDDIGLSFADNGDLAISFYWKDLLIELTFLQGNVFTAELPPFDFYFERAFRIIKEQDSSYEKKIVDKLTKNGLIISDSGFKDFQLEKIIVPAELSAYGEMIIGIKR
ncbi:hypothetical protein HYX12_03875 [Candidatus Woesearchaeota archaeon]|nr:hypothetical protein [Candidatus Woesearchaeota archaeon]